MIAPANTRTKPYTLNASEPVITAITKPTGAEQNARIAPFRANRHGFFAVTITEDEDREQRSSRFKGAVLHVTKAEHIYPYLTYFYLHTTTFLLAIPFVGGSLQAGVPSRAVPGKAEAKHAPLCKLFDLIGIFCARGCSSKSKLWSHRSRCVDPGYAVLS